MRKLVFTLGIALGLCGATSVFGQDVPRIEVFGGYSYLNLDTNGLSPRQSANGWEASVSGNINRWFAVEGDVAGYYKTYTVDLTSLELGIFNVNVHDYSYLGGPRINLGPVFFHALVGGDTLTGSASGFSSSQTGFAIALGGGVEWKVAPHVAVRGSADYALTRHNIFGGPAVTQNNVRVSVGIVYAFGGRREAAPSGGRNTPASQECAGSSEAARLGVVGCGSDGGFNVTSVRYGSPAAQAGVVPGDVITSIDGRPVHSSREIEVAIAANTSGTIKIAYMIKGNWLTEHEVKVR